MRTTSIRLCLAATATSLALVATAQAAALRTFVASTGSDANTASNCAVTAPCRTLAQAFTVTSNNGEIIILDAGGYGAVFINRPVAIIGVPGALVGVPSGGVGIGVGAGASDIVIIRNILFTGAAAANTTGVALTSGRLIIENSTFRMLSTGLSVTNSKADVNDSAFIGNTTAISTNGTGADAQNFPATGGTTHVRIAGGKVLNNTTAFHMINPGLRPSPATDNLITIFLFNDGGGYSTIVAGNTTVTTGTGASCSPSPNCTNLGQYSTQLAPLNFK